MATCTCHVNQQQSGTNPVCPEHGSLYVPAPPPVAPVEPSERGDDEVTIP